MSICRWIGAPTLKGRVTYLLPRLECDLVSYPSGYGHGVRQRDIGAHRGCRSRRGRPRRCESHPLPSRGCDAHPSRNATATANCGAERRHHRAVAIPAHPSVRALCPIVHIPHPTWKGPVVLRAVARIPKQPVPARCVIECQCRSITHVGSRSRCIGYKVPH